MTRNLVLTAVLAIAWFSTALAAEETVSNLGIGGGAGICASAVSPHDDALMMVISTRATAFVSRDGGASWKLIDSSNLPRAANCAPLFDPEDDKVIYAASGSTLKVSRNKGQTWKPLLEADAPWKSDGIARLAIEPGGKKSMFAMTGNAMYRSEDRGKHWRQVIGFNGPCAGVVPLATHTYTAYGTSIFESTDGGFNWNPRRIAPADSRITSLTGGYTRGGRMVIYAAVPGVGVLGSGDMGRTWSTALAEPGVEHVAMASNQDKVTFAASAEAVWKTDDGGKTWLKCFGSGKGAAMSGVRRSWLADDLGRSCNVLPSSMALAGSAAGVVLLGTEGELYISKDCGKCWAPAMNASAGKPAGQKGNAYSSVGLEANCPWEFYLDPRRRQHALIAYSDSGLARSNDQGTTWTPSVEGSPAKGTFYNIAFDPFTDGRIYASVSEQPDVPAWSALDQVLDSGAVAVSDDGGQTWRQCGKGLPNKPCTWVTIDPKSTKGGVILYAAVFGDGVYKSVDAGKTWTSKSNGLGRPGNKNVFMVKVQPKSGDVYCCITGIRKDRELTVPGGLWRSRDGGDTWEDLTAKLNLHWPAGFDLDPKDPTVVYLAASGDAAFPEGALYKSTTEGTSWVQAFKPQDCGADNKAQPLRCWFVSVSPHDNELVYLSTQDHGLFVSKDTGATWSHVDWVPCADVTRVSFPPFEKASVYVSTFGAGVWKGPVNPKAVKGVSP